LVDLDDLDLAMIDVPLAWLGPVFSETPIAFGGSIPLFGLATWRC
jgi:hypothetical protein